MKQKKHLLLYDKVVEAEPYAKVLLYSLPPFELRDESEVLIIMSILHSITRDTNKSRMEFHFNDFSMTLDEYSETMYPKGNEGGDLLQLQQKISMVLSKKLFQSQNVLIIWS